MIRNAARKTITTAVIVGALAVTTLSSTVAHAASSPKLGEIVVTKATDTGPGGTAAPMGISEFVITKSSDSATTRLH